MPAGLVPFLVNPGQTRHYADTLKNPRRRRKNPRGRHPRAYALAGAARLKEASPTVAYRRYLIRGSVFHPGELLVEKDGHVIAHMARRTLEQAKAIVDLVATPGENPRGRLMWRPYAPGKYAAPWEGGAFLIARAAQGWTVTYRGGTSQPVQHVGRGQTLSHAKMLAQVAKPNPRRAARKSARRAAAVSSHSQAGKRNPTMAARMRRDSRGRFLSRARRNDPGRRRRRRSFSSTRSNPPRRHRRRGYRRNPPMFRGIVGRVVNGVQRAIPLTIGDGLSSMAPPLLKQDKTTYVGMLIKIGAGALLGIVADMVGFRRWSEDLIAGSATGVVRGLVTKFNVPVLAGALSEYPQLVEVVPQGRLSAYPQLAGSQGVDIYGTALAGYPPQYTGQ